MWGERGERNGREERKEWRVRKMVTYSEYRTQYNSLAATLTGATGFLHYHFSQFEDEATRASVCLAPHLEGQGEDEQENRQTAAHD